MTKLQKNKSYQAGIIGLGFWAQYQVSAWNEIEDVTIAAVCDVDAEKAKAFAEKFNVPHFFTSAEEMMDTLKLDFVDIITNPETHADLVELAARKKVSAICQKPMAPDLTTGKRMVDACHAISTLFFVHENFRFQAPMLAVKELLNSEEIGKPFKARIYFNTSFPVLKNQPGLREMERMIIADLGIHLFDLVRFFFGEVKFVFCRTRQIAADIKGEDVATCLLETRGGVHCQVELSFASHVEYDSFPQTLVSIEGTKGTINLNKDCQLTVFRSDTGQRQIAVNIPKYSWVNPDYEVVHTSIVACNQDILNALKGIKKSENVGAKNLETLKLVAAAYESAEGAKVVDMDNY